MQIQAAARVTLLQRELTVAASQDLLLNSPKQSLPLLVKFEHFSATEVGSNRSLKDDGFAHAYVTLCHSRAFSIRQTTDLLPK